MSENSRAPVPHFVTLPGGQLRVWLAGDGPLVLLLPGLLRGPVARTREAAEALPGRTVVGIELPGLGGSSLTDVFSTSGAFALLAGWLKTLPASLDVLAFDLAGPLLLDLQRATKRVRSATWVDGDRALAWPASEDFLEELPLADDGTHLQRLWGHLRRRDMLNPTDVRRARTDGDYLSANELDEALLCFGVDADAYSAHWNWAMHAARRLLSENDAEVRRGSLGDVSNHLQGTPLGQAILFPKAATPKHRIVREYVQVERGRVHLRRSGGGERLLLAFLAGAGSSVNMESLLTGLSHSRVVVAPDYIGQGDSCRNTTPTTVTQLARDADEIASAMGFSKYDVYGTHTGAGVAIEAAIAFPDRVGKVIIDGISMQDPAQRAEHREKYFPSIEPDAWGTHVHKAWHVRRDGGYFWPWYRPESIAARAGRAPSLELLQDRVISTLRSQTTPAYQAIASYAARARLPLLTQPGLFVAGPNDTFVSHMDAARDVAPPNLQFLHVPATVWFAGQDPAAVGSTLQTFESFLNSTRTAG